MNFLKNKVVIFVITVIVICIMLSILGNSLGAGNPVSNTVGIVLSPFQKIITSTRRGLESVPHYFTDFKKLETENKELKEHLSDLESQLRDVERYKLENVRLRKLLDLQNGHPDYEIEMAQVLAYDPGNWFTSFTIDKGSLTGIEKMDPVITGEGIVGYVEEVGTTWSTVVTILEPGVTVGSMVSRSRDVGILEGDFELLEKGRCRLSYIPKSANIIKDDYIETSGLGGVYPKGLVIGMVEEIGLESHGLSQYAVIKPAADLSSLCEVVVIKSFSEEGAASGQ